MAMPNRELSIIIPCHNEAALIERCLGSVVAQLIEAPAITRPEIVVVPNACTDQTTDIARAFFESHDEVPSRVMPLEGRGKKLALNVGLAAARGEVVICVDADVEVLPGAVDRAYEDIHQGNTRLVGGQYVPVISEGLVNVKPAPSIEMLRHAKRMVTQPHRSVAGRFVGFYRRDLRDGFPEQGAAADDLWLSAHMGTKFGIDSIHVSSEAAVTFIPPATMKDLRAQLHRFRRARPTVISEFPQMRQFFEAIDAHCLEVDGDDLRVRWRQEAYQNGVDFDRWIIEYEQLIEQTDRRIARHRRTAELPIVDVWEPLRTTKKLPGVAVPNVLTATT